MMESAESDSIIYYEKDSSILVVDSVMGCFTFIVSSLIPESVSQNSICLQRICSDMSL